MTRIPIAGVVLLCGGCLPFPSQAPRVEKGWTVLTPFVGTRVMVDSTSEGKSSTFVVPDLGLSTAVGFRARAEGGLAARVAIGAELPVGAMLDLYVQNPLPSTTTVSGMGVAFRTGQRATMPYAMWGWRTRSDHILYLAQGAVFNGPRANDAGPATVTTSTVIGWQTRRERLSSGGTTVTSGRVYAAFFFGRPTNEPSLHAVIYRAQAPARSVIVVGWAADVTVPWSDCRGTKSGCFFKPKR